MSKVPAIAKMYVGATAIDKAILSIKNRGAKLDNDIQLVGLSVLAHTAEHGDTGVMDRLVNAMPKSARKLALVEWMLAYGRARKLDLEGAQEKKWHEFRLEAAVVTAFDAQSAVAALLARMKAASAKGLTIEHKAQALADAKALVEMLEADDAE